MQQSHAQSQQSTWVCKSEEDGRIGRFFLANTAEGTKVPILFINLGILTEEEMYGSSYSFNPWFLYSLGLICQ